VEFRIRRPDGEIRWISDRGRATLDDSGRVVCFRGVTQDVTERRKAEHALRESEERLHLALETAELGMWEWQPTTDTFYLDERECRLLGATPATAPKTSVEFIQLVHPDDREIVLEAVRRAFRTGESSAGEVRVRMPDGHYRWLTSTGCIVRDASGNIEIVRGITLDITHRRKLEGQLRLAQKMEAIGQLAGGVAHDFNNLLTVIRGHIELILDRAAGNQELQHNAMAAQEAARRAASITQQLLAFSRRQVLQPRVLELNQVVKKSAELLRRLIRANIELQIETGPEPLWIKADASQLEQVLMNLVVNARDAMPAGGPLKVTTEPLPADSLVIRRQIGMPDVKYALLTVRDTGVGMDAVTQAHIFDPFFTTKEPGKGTGLGLATVYGIVKQSSGWIFVESELGKGSAFLVFFPETAAGSDREAPKSARPGRLIGNETILVAEDQEDVRTLTVDYLTSLGYTVLAAENGESALDLAERESGQIHLLLTDAMMPRMSGLALARRLRERRPGIKVLYISGYANDAAALEGIGFENEPFLQKPFAMDELARKVRGLLD
jgi:PAS domain S-box-containing protein